MLKKKRIISRRAHSYLPHAYLYLPLWGLCFYAFYSIDPDLIESFRWPGIHAFLLVTALLFSTERLCTFLARKPSLGMGDIKLAGLLAFWMGTFNTLTALALACILGGCYGILTLIKNGSRPIPFGPFIAVGAFVVHQYPYIKEMVK
ncbi:MAG: prepilin peptidase [Planctomycetes bacterium]|nr:prepilin peptidase [Planctomycetota bacterium]